MTLLNFVFSQSNLILESRNVNVPTLLLPHKRGLKLQFCSYFVVVLGHRSPRCYAEQWKKLDDDFFFCICQIQPLRIVLRSRGAFVQCNNKKNFAKSWDSKMFLYPFGILIMYYVKSPSASICVGIFFLCFSSLFVVAKLV